MNTSTDHVRDRIFAAADELYAENNKSTFPTVDAVRKKARVNMNDASTEMKEWRRLAQSAKTDAIASPLPAELQARAAATLAAFWDKATSLASESLLAAQAGWESERQEGDELRRQMAAAYDTQSTELAVAQQEISRLSSQIQTLADEVAAIRRRVAEADDERDRAKQTYNETAAALIEASNRVEDLQTAVAHAREEAERARADADAIRRERQRYEELAATALTDAARLRGRLEAFEVNLSMAAGAVKSSGKRASDGKKATGGHDA